MKLLFDQNISFRILKKLEDVFPQAQQVRGLSLENATDKAIWAFAKKNDYTIVTFDADFSDIVSIEGHPPKIIWLRTGNLTTTNVAAILKKHHNLITEFIQKKEYNEIACLEIK